MYIASTSQRLTIHDLPDELLIEIFSFLAPWTPAGIRKEKPYADLTAIMQICRRWHRTVLSTPTLWTFVDVTTDIRSVIVCLERSNPMPIHYRKLAASIGDSAAQVLLDHDALKRIQTLKVCEDDPARKFATDLLSILSSDSATNVNLMMNLREMHMTTTGFWSDTSFSFNMDSLATNAPTLKHLNIGEIQPIATPGCFSRLHSLTIAIQRRSHYPPLTSFLQGFSPSNPIRHLDLHIGHVLQVEKHEISYASCDLQLLNMPPVSFPELRYLRLVSTCEDIRYFLDHVTLPKDVPFMSIATLHESFDDIIPQHIASIFHSAFPLNSAISLEILIFQNPFHSRRIVDLSVLVERIDWPPYVPSGHGVFGDDDAFPYHLELEEKRFMKRISSTNTSMSAEGLIDYVIRSFSSPQIKQLRIDDNVKIGITTELYLKLFRAFPSVERIHLPLRGEIFLAFEVLVEERNWNAIREFSFHIAHEGVEPYLDRLVSMAELRKRKGGPIEGMEFVTDIIDNASGPGANEALVFRLEGVVTSKVRVRQTRSDLY